MFVAIAFLLASFVAGAVAGYFLAIPAVAIVAVLGIVLFVIGKKDLTAVAATPLGPTLGLLAAIAAFLVAMVATAVVVRLGFQLSFEDLRRWILR